MGRNHCMQWFWVPESGLYYMTQHNFKCITDLVLSTKYKQMKKVRNKQAFPTDGVVVLSNKSWRQSK